MYFQATAKALLALLLVLSGSVSSGLAAHSETDETGWFEYAYNEDDNEVLYCNGLGYIPVGDLYIHDRAGPGAPYGTGMIRDGGGGTWIYQESNGIPGLQVHFGSGLPPQDVLELLPFYWSDPRDPCPNADMVLF